MNSIAYPRYHLHPATALAALLLCAIGTVRAQQPPPDTSNSSLAQPRLALVDTLDPFAGRFAYIPEIYGSFRGLLVEECDVTEYHPVLPYVYFDWASATIPLRYHLFDSVAQTESFDEEAIPGGTLEHHYHILNVIGYRLRHDPGITINLVGCNSWEPGLGETRAVSDARGVAVYDYLTTVWYVPPRQIVLCLPRDLPAARSHPWSPNSRADNRRAEISVGDMERLSTDHTDAHVLAIRKPVRQVSRKRTMVPSTVRFAMDNGMSDSLVMRREIEIRRGGRLWSVLKANTLADLHEERLLNWPRDSMSRGVPMFSVSELGPVDSMMEYEWRDLNGAAPGSDESDYVAQLVVYGFDGNTYRSNEVRIPVLYLSRDRVLAEFKTVRALTIASLMEMPGDGYRHLGPLNEYLASKTIVPEIRKGVRIEVIGRTSAISLPDRNLRITQNRADQLRSIIQRRFRDVYGSLVARGIGESLPLYDKNLPEGRALNRSLRVTVDASDEVVKIVR